MDAWSAAVVRWLTAHGISLFGSRVLVVRGRKSGEPRSTPVNLLELDGERYLVAPRGNTQWVRNARAAGVAELRLGQRAEAVELVELPADQRVPVLRVYLDQVGLGGRPVRRGPVEEVHRRRDRRGRAGDAGLPRPHRRLSCSWLLERLPWRPPEHPTRAELARVGPVSDALVHRADDDRIAVLTLDSPANRNALSRRLVAELTEHLAEAGADESLHGVLLRSSHPVFCAGADLKEAATVDMVESARGIIGLQRAIADLPVPVVCRLDGPVRAGGLGLVASSDVVVCRDDVTFALTEVRLGPRGRGHLDPAAGPTQPARGIRLVPHRPARSGPPRRVSRDWSPTSCPPTGSMPPCQACSTTCGRVPGRVWWRPSGCSTPTSSRRSTSAATRWPGCPGCCSTRAVAQERMAAALRR